MTNPDARNAGLALLDDLPRHILHLARAFSLLISFRPSDKYLFSG